MLDENNRKRLDGIVQQMVQNGEDDATINTVVTDFKSKYGTPDTGTIGEMSKIVTDPIRNVVQGGKQFLKDVGEEIGITAPQKPEDRGIFGRIQQGARDVGTDIRQAIDYNKQSNLYGPELPTKQPQITPEIGKSPFYTEGQIGGISGTPDTQAGQREAGFFSGNLMGDISERIIRYGFNSLGDIFGSAIGTISPDALKAPLNTPEGQKALEYVITNVEGGIDKLANYVRPNDPQGQREFKNLLEGLSYMTPAPFEKQITKGLQRFGKAFESEAGLNLARGAVDQAGKVIKPVGETVDAFARKMKPKINEFADDLIYEAVNPTKLENKMIVQERANDLKQYLKGFDNDLETVKGRIDKDMGEALGNMKNYEDTTGVKGTVDTAPIIAQLEDKYFKYFKNEHTGEFSLINPDQAKAAQEMIDRLVQFGPTVRDNDIIRIRRAWDDIIEKNKGFMRSVDSNYKADVYYDANKFFRSEIRKSNPEYAQFLEKFHRTKTLSDVIDATLNRRAGQTKGGFIKRGLRATARSVGIGTGIATGNFAAPFITELLIQGGDFVSTSSFKLSVARILSKLKEYGITDTVRVSADSAPDGILAKQRRISIPSSASLGDRVIAAWKDGRMSAKDATAEILRKAEQGFVTPDDLRRIAKENPEIGAIIEQTEREAVLSEGLIKIDRRLKLHPSDINKVIQEMKKGWDEGNLTEADMEYMYDNTKSPLVKKAIQAITDPGAEEAKAGASAKGTKKESKTQPAQEATAEPIVDNSQVGPAEKLIEGPKGGVNTPQAPDVPPTPPKLLPEARGGSKDVNVGISSVKGRTEGYSDSMIRDAEEMYKNGDVEGAQKLFDQAMALQDETIKKAFDGTGITVKNKGTGYGIFEGVLEPNHDLVATIPAGKEDLFRNILADIADKKFRQKSVLTYRPTSETKLGPVQGKAGVSIEPRIRINFSKPLSIDEMHEVNKMFAEVGFPGASIRDKGKALDILNLSHYNSDYNSFLQNYEKLLDKLQAYSNDRGITSTTQLDTQEAWFAGSDLNEAPTTFKETQRRFREQNPEYLDKNSKYTSDILEKIGNRKTVTRSEVEAMMKNGGISEIEKKTVAGILEKYDAKAKIPASELQKSIQDEMLKIGVNESNKYADYGLERIGIDSPDYSTTLVYNTPVTHGKTGHFDDPNLFGHARIAVDGDQGYVVEVQSDLFQHDLPNMPVISKRITSSKDTVPRDVLTMEGGIIDEYTPRDIESYRGNTENNLDKLKAFGKKDKYRERILNETMYKLREKGAKEMNVATPSTAAKIEGFSGAGEGAPYDYINNDRVVNGSPDAEVGDTISYGGEDYQVLQSDRYANQFTAAPADRIHTVDAYEWTQGEVDSKISEAQYELKSDIREGISPERAQELIDEGNMSQEAEKFLQKVIDEGKFVDELNSGGYWDNLRDDIEADYDVLTNLEDIYGTDNIFIRDKDTYYIVEDGANIELFGQPSEYNTDIDGLKDIDTDKSRLAEFGFSQTEESVLKNYYELHDYLKKYAKDNNLPIRIIEDPNGNTWFNMPIIPGKIKGF